MNKRNLWLLVCFVFTMCSSIAQSLKSIKFSKDGNSYYQNEMGNIYKISLPDLDKKMLITKENLLPADKAKALSIKGFAFSNDETKALIFTNTKKVWRYETRGDYWVFDTTTKKLQTTRCYITCIIINVCKIFAQWQKSSLCVQS